MCKHQLKVFIQTLSPSFCDNSTFFLWELEAAEQRRGPMLLKQAGAVRSSLWRGDPPQPCQTHPGCKNQMTCLFALAAPASGAAEHSPTVGGGG